MSCVKSYTYDIQQSDNGGLFGLFFGGGGNNDKNVKYYITINIMSAYGDYKPVRIIADTGNDITLLTKSTADMLGFNPNIGALLEVSGIREGMVSRFKKINTFVQLGNLQPVRVEVGFALDHDSLQENLLGNKGILSSGNFSFVYGKDSLTIYDNINTCGVTSGMAKEKLKYKKNTMDSYFTKRYY